MELERRSFAVENMEVRSEAGQPTVLRGYAAVFDKLSVPLYGYREKIQRGAFTRSLKKNNIKALWNHNDDYPLGSTRGKTLTLEEDERGLRFELELPNNSWGRDAKIAIQRKDVEGVSFGFNIIKDEWDHSDKDNPIRTLVDVNLIEISPTPFPAYPATSVSARSLLRNEGIDYERLAPIFIRAQNNILTDAECEYVDSVIKVLRGLTKPRVEARRLLDRMKKTYEMEWKK